MRNLSKLKTTWKGNNQKHGKFNHKHQKLSKVRQHAVSHWIFGKIEEVKTSVGKLLGQVFSSSLPKEMQLQPVQNRKIRKSTILLVLSVLMTTSLFTNCSTKVPKAENRQEPQLDTAGTNEDYLAIIEDYRTSKVENLSSYNQENFTFQTVMMNDIRTDYQQTIDTLKYQQSVMKMKIDNFQDNGKESWEAFKAELNQDIDDMKKALNDSSAIKGQ